MTSHPVPHDDFFEVTQLKHRYLRLLDTKKWDALRALFTDDAAVAYGEHAFEGADNIIGFLRKSLGVPGCISDHSCSQPEFTSWTSEKIEATWALTDRVIYLKYDIQIEGAAYYHDTYRKKDGHWLIERTGYERQYEQRFSRSSFKNLTMTANRFPLEDPA
jgi:hypothetical protein